MNEFHLNKGDGQQMSDELEPQKPSVFGMINNPIEQFKRIKERPVFWGALVIATIIFLVGLIISFQYIDVSEELLQELAREAGEELTDEIRAVFEVAQSIGVVIGGVIGPIFGVLMASLIHLLVGKIASAQVTFRQLFSMNTHIMMITAIGVVVNGILLMIFSGEFGVGYTSLGILFDPGEPIGAMASQIEIFSIWNLILTAIGLQQVANFSKGIAWGVPIIMFVVGLLFALV